MSILVSLLLFYTVIEHSVMVSARGCPGSTCISPVWLERCKLSLSLSLKALLASNVCGPWLLALVLLRVPAWLCPCAFHWTAYKCSPSGLCATLAAMANARDVISICLSFGSARAIFRGILHSSSVLPCIRVHDRLGSPKSKHTHSKREVERERERERVYTFPATQG